jgi:hypothetical protein
VFDPLTFLERLAALVPRPRKKLVNYFGVFASAASYRSRVVPPPEALVPNAAGDAPPRCAHRRPDPPAPDLLPEGSAAADDDTNEHRPAAARPHFRGVPHAPRKRTKKRRYYFWSELLERVFLHNALVCTHCGGPRRLLSFVSDQDVIRRILLHLGLPANPPELAPARPPPGRSVHFVRS